MKTTHIALTLRGNSVENGIAVSNELGLALDAEVNIMLHEGS